MKSRLLTRPATVLWVNWVLATIAGALVGLITGFLCLATLNLQLPSRYDYQEERIILFGVIYGGVLAATQNRVISIYLRRKWLWLLLTPVAWGFYWWLHLTLFRYKSPSLRLSIAAGALAGTVMGVVQFWAIQTSLKKASIWIVVSLLGGIASSAIGFRLLNESAGIFAWLVGVAVWGIISGCALAAIALSSNFPIEDGFLLPSVSKGKSNVFTIQSLPVAFAVVDFLWTYIKLRRQFGDEDLYIGHGITPLQIAVQGPGILMLATVGLWLKRPWSLVVAAIVSWLLMKEGWRELTFIVENNYLVLQSDQWLWTALKVWWVDWGRESDITACLMAVVVFLSSIVLLLRTFLTRRSQKPATTPSIRL